MGMLLLTRMSGDYLQFHPFQAEGIGDDRDRAETHGRGRQHRRKENAEKGKRTPATMGTPAVL
jgi:hypothetical protein